MRPACSLRLRLLHHPILPRACPLRRCASWITSPILGAVLSCFCFWLLRTLVLRHDNAYQRAFYVLVGAVTARC